MQFNLLLVWGFNLILLVTFADLHGNGMNQQREPVDGNCHSHLKTYLAHFNSISRRIYPKP